MKGVFKSFRKTTKNSSGKDKSHSFSHSVPVTQDSLDKSWRIASLRKTESFLSIKEILQRPGHSPLGFKRSLSIRPQQPKEGKDLKRNWRSASWSHRPQRSGSLESNAFLSRPAELSKNGSLSNLKETSVSVQKFSNLARYLRTRKHSYSVVERENSDVNISPCGEGTTAVSWYGQQTEQPLIDFLTSNFCNSLSSNIWYYGELDIIRGYRRNLRKSKDIVGSMIVMRSLSGDLVYTITYNIGDQVLNGKIPQIGGCYCLDFLNTSEPKFNNLNGLVNHMIKKNHLQRVSFEWLLVNVSH